MARSHCDLASRIPFPSTIHDHDDDGDDDDNDDNDDDDDVDADSHEDDDIIFPCIHLIIWLVIDMAPGGMDPSKTGCLFLQKLSNQSWKVGFVS